MVDINKCTGCKMCESVCSLGHEGKVIPSQARLTVIKNEEQGLDVPVFCQQCEQPLCREVCPVNAIEIDRQTGATIIDSRRCLGCGMCVMACPIGGITVTSNKVMKKCDLCNGDPLCAKYCPTNALQYMSLTKLTQQRRRKGIMGMLQFMEKEGD